MQPIQNKVIKLDDKTSKEISKYFVNKHFKYLKQYHYVNNPQNAAIIISENELPFEKEIDNCDVAYQYEIISYNDNSIYNGFRFLNLPKETALADPQQQDVIDILINNNYLEPIGNNHSNVRIKDNNE